MPWHVSTCDNVTMGYIKRLSEDLIKKIAAGEVIERPASVVKELVENSIDALSTKIEIEIQRSGKYIKISDNGMGIDPIDIDLLFTRYATSKIKSFDDLWRVNSLGFRGEALASVSAVSKITCRSKHLNQEHGFVIKVIDGKITDKKSSAISIGTVFEVDDLFYNVPARQKFLKSETTEIGHINDLILSLALSHPKISFTLLNNKDIIFKSSGSSSLEQAVVELLGNDLKSKLISISKINHFVELSGFVSSLEINRTNKKFVYIFINNRWIKCQIISKAIQSAFEGLLPPGKFPLVVLKLNFKPKFVDVNVHPAKREVRYIHPNDVYNLVLHSIQEAISNYYKKEYGEQLVYSFEKDRPATSEPRPVISEFAAHSSQLRAPGSYSEAAFDLYAPLEVEPPVEERSETAKGPAPPAERGEQTSKVVQGTIEEQQIFSVNHLQCKVIYSEKPTANMTKIGSKTIFEVGSIFDDNVQIIFSGEVAGNSNYQKEFLNNLSDLSKNIYQSLSKNESVFQKKLVNRTLDEEIEKETKRKKPPEELLYKVWERDNWTCVYCGKQLLDPKTVKESMPKAKDAFVTYINKEGKEITNHILREHTASYDHYLPASKLPQFNTEIENLYSCCFECNRKKLDSMSLETWKPKRQNSWNVPLEITGLCFNNSKKLLEKIDLKI